MKPCNKKETLCQFITIGEATQLLNASRGTVYNLIKAGKLKKYKLTDKSTRLKASDIAIYIESKVC